MLIDLGEEVKITVKIGAKSFDLREPRQRDIEALQKAGDSQDAFAEFVESLGMPRDEVDGLGILRLRKLADGLTGALTAKK